MIRMILIDDEQPARQALRALLGSFCPNVTVVGEARGVAEGVALIRQENPHGVLLDISMEDGTGFDLLDFFPRPTFKVIFTTAHDTYALRAFEYSALDYLLKPIDPKALIRAVDRIQLEPVEAYQQKLAHFFDNRGSLYPNKIALPTQEGLVLLRLDQVVYLEADSNYTTFISADGGRLVVSRPIGEFEGLLPPSSFFRLHQSYMVNLNFVQKVLKEDGGLVLLESGAKVPIARRRKEAFMELIKQ